MRIKNSTTLLFAIAVSAVCALCVAGSVVLLRDRQQENAELERQRNVLAAANLIAQDATPAEIAQAYGELTPVHIDLATGEPCSAPSEATRDAPANPAGISKIPVCMPIFQKRAGDQIELHILPIEGQGLWSRLYGFLALNADGRTVRGLSFYKHGETPGLGGEISNPRWTKKWENRKVFNNLGNVDIAIIKGIAGPAESDPHRVDGLSGATLTGRGVTNLLRFWLSDEGYGRYLKKHQRGAP